MSVSRPLLLGLGGLALLGVVQWVILPAFEYRADNASRAERARQRHLSMQLLTDDYARLSQSNAAAPAKNRSLFSLVNKEADRLSLSRRIEALRPAARKENDGSERIEMSVSRPLLLGLGGLALLGVVQWVILPAFEYRADNASRAERARQRHLSMQLLTDDYARLSQSNAAAPAKNRSLFSLVNKEADRLSLSRRIEALRPAARKENDGSERIEMRLAGLYLKQGVQWLHALESHPGVRVENLTFRRSAKNLLDMDMTVSLSGGTQ